MECDAQRRFDLTATGKRRGQAKPGRTIWLSGGCGLPPPAASSRRD